MVKRVEPAVLGPWVCSWVKTFVTEMAGVDFADEREGSVEVGVPGDGSDGEKGDRGERRAGVHDRLYAACQ